MNLSDVNSKVWEFLENPILKSNNFEEFSKLLINKKLLEEIKIYLNLLLDLLLKNYIKLQKKNKKIITQWNLEINRMLVRQFMSLFLFLHFPKIHNLEKDIKICRDLLNLSRQLKFLFRGIVIFMRENTISKIEESNKFIIGFLPVSYSFFSKLELYLDTFNRWKKYDLENLIFKMSYDYYKFENEILNSDNIEIHPELIVQCQKEKKHLVRLVHKLDKVYGKIKFREYLDVIQDYDGLTDEIANQLFIQKISNLIHTNIMIEEWDQLELEIEEKIYDSLGKMLVKIKDTMKDCQPKNNSFHLEVDEVLDEEFIISQIESQVFNISNFHKLTEFIFFYLEKFQSPSEDENTKLFRDEIALLLQDKNDNLPFIIRFFLEHMYLKFDSIRRQFFIFQTANEK